MKKIIIGMLAFALCLGMNSCKEKATPKEDKTSKEQTSKKEEKETPSMKAAKFLEKAKAEGEKWSQDEWKAAFKEMMDIYIGMAANTAVLEIKKDEEKDPAKLAELDTKIKEAEKEGDDFLKEFGETAMKSPNGILLMLDEEWMNDFKKKYDVNLNFKNKK